MTVARDCAGDHRLGIVASRRTSSRPLVCGQTKGYWSNIFHTKGQACCYFVFVFLMCWAVILQTQRSRDVYFLSHLMEDKLLFEEFEARDSHVKKLFADIGEVTEFWQWLRGPVSSSIANPDWSSEREPRLGSGFIHGHNRVVGPVRLRQVCPLAAARVKGGLAARDAHLRATLWDNAHSSESATIAARRSTRLVLMAPSHATATSLGAIVACMYRRPLHGLRCLTPACL